MTRMKPLSRFLRDKDGGLSVEAAMILPVLLWAYLGLFVFIDAFQSKSINIKAAATIGDLLSREQEEVNADYMEGLNDVLGFLTHSNHDTIMRVSVVRYDAVDDEHILVWSYGTAGKPHLTQGSLGEIEPDIPVMQDAGTVIVVETWMAYEPFLNVGLEPMYYENVVVTSPRFAPQLKWETPTS